MIFIAGVLRIKSVAADDKISDILIFFIFVENNLSHPPAFTSDIKPCRQQNTKMLSAAMFWQCLNRL